MNDALLFNGDPCERCDERRIETETGDPYCIASPSGERDCALIGDLKTMEEVARTVAREYRRICDRTMRREIVEGTACGFGEAIALQRRGVTFDAAYFCELCGCPREVMP